MSAAAPLAQLPGSAPARAIGHWALSHREHPSQTLAGSVRSGALASMRVWHRCRPGRRQSSGGRAGAVSTDEASFGPRRSPPAVRPGS